MAESLKDASRKNISSDSITNLKIVEVGCLQRIASSLESMAADRDRIIGERNYYRHECNHAHAEIATLKRRIAALRGTITRMKQPTRN